MDALGLIGQLLDVIRPGHVAKPEPKPDNANGYRLAFRPARGGGSWKVR